MIINNQNKNILVSLRKLSIDCVEASNESNPVGFVVVRIIGT